MENFFYVHPTCSRMVSARIASVLLTMIPGEEPHPEIFETVHSGFSYLTLTEERNIKNVETIIVLRILYHLGYVVKNSATESFLANTVTWIPELFLVAEKQHAMLVKIINNGMKESQLH